MEEQADATSEVARETEGVGAADELFDVARKDRDEECGREPSDEHPVSAEKEEREAEDEFDDSGCDDDEIYSERQPLRNLRDELRAGEGEVRSAREDEEEAQYP